MDDKINQINSQIQAASFLSDEEKSLLSDILPFWPEIYLNSLSTALAGFKTPGASIDDLKKRLREGPNIRESLGTYEGGSVKLRHSNPIGSIPKIRANTPVLPRYTPGEVVPSDPSRLSRTGVWGRMEFSAKDVASNIYALRSSEQLSKITLSDLRQGDFYKNLNLILQKVTEIASREKTVPYVIIQNFEKSPVNQLFIRTGLALMDDITPDRNVAYSKVSNLMRAKFKDAFAKSEFDAFAEFKERLQSLI